MPKFTVDTDLNDVSANSLVTVDRIERFILSVKRDSPLAQDARSFIDAANENYINILWVISHAILETGWGMSYFSKVRNNLYGIAAYDSNPNAAWDFPSHNACIKYYCAWIKKAYLSPSGKWWGGSSTPKGMNVHYASSQVWANNIVTIMNQFGTFINKDLNEQPQPSPVIAAIPAPIDFIPYRVKSGESLGVIFKNVYGRYPNWSAWAKGDPNGDLQRMINFARSHGSKIDGKDTIYTNQTLYLPKSI